MPDRPETSNAARILIVEDKMIPAKDLARSLSNIGYEVVGRVSSAEEAVRRVEESKPDLILMDIKFGGAIHGMEPVEQIRSRFDIPVAYLTGFDDSELVERAEQTKPYGYLGKASNQLEMKCMIETALRRHEAETRLKESEDGFRRLVENAKDVIFRLSVPDGMYEYMSAASNEIFGCSPEEFYSTPLLLREIIHPDWLGSFETEWTRLQNGKMPPYYEYQIIHRSGDVRWLHQRNVLIENDFGRPVAIEGIIMDITDRKRSEEALKESERRYRLLAGNTLDVSWQMDVNLSFTYINHTIAGIMGYTVDEWIGTKLQDHCDEENFQKMAHEVAVEIAKGKAGTGAVFEAMMLKKNGEPIHVEIHGKVIWGEDGNPLGLQGVTRDITDRKKTEEALRDSEEFNRRIVHHAPLGILYLTVDGVISFTNPANNRIFGVPEDQPSPLVGLNILQLPLIVDQPHVVAGFEKLVKEGKPLRDIELDYRSPLTGKDYVLLVSATPRLSSEGAVVGSVVMISDITERKRVERALQRHQNELEERITARTAELTKLSEKLKTEIAIRKRTEEALWKEKAFIEGALDALSDVFCVIDLEQRFVRWNEALTEISGYTDEEVSSMKPTDFFSGEDVQKVAEHIELVVMHGYSKLDASVATKGDEHIPFELTGDLLKDLDGRPTSICVVGRDVSERKRTEKALRESEARYRAIFNNAAVGIDIVDKAGCFMQVNEPLAEMLGYSEEELLGRSVFELTHPDDLELSRAGHETLVEGRSQSYSLQKRFLKKDGTSVWAEISVSPLYNEYGEYEATIGVIADITERKQAEQALRESEEKYRSIIEFIGDAYYEVDLAGNMVFCNDATCRISGYTREELIGMNNRRYMDDATAKEVFKIFNKVYRTGEPASLSGWRFIRKDGKRIMVETQVSLVRNADGNPCGFRGYSRDITEKKKADAALVESEAKYRTVIENVKEGYYEVDLSGNMTYCNDAMCRMLSYSRNELIGMNNRRYMDEGTSAHVFRTFNSVYRTGDPVTVHGWRFLTKEGTTRLVDTSVSLVKDSDGKPAGFRGIVRDVTERERLQMQSMQAQKMEAIGSLAGGIAHDFNNILYAIMGFTELALEEVPEDTVLRSNLETVLKSGHRAKDLVNQILAFSRQSRQEKRMVNVVPIAKEAIKFLRASLPSTIEIMRQLEPELRPIVADPTEIHQILMNLCTNAGHSMREAGGFLELTIENVDLEEADITLAPEIVPGPYLRMTVRDTGTGMAPEVVKRIFEPYFTTKPKGEGTGLGLAVTHGIVASYGGTVRVDSEIGKGSTFQVYLPSVEAQARRERRTADTAIPKGSERILFVDDEPTITRMAKRMLDSLGYSVVSLTSSLEALEFFRTRQDEFDLVITDMTMPRMTGIELVQEIRKMGSKIPLVLCTGFSELIPPNRETLGIDELIMKPILKKDMAEVVRRVLDRSTGTH